MTLTSSTSLARTSLQRAFTLVELLVVIGIIALLISILLPTLSAARQSARDLQCGSNMRQLGTSMLQYAIDYDGRYSTNINELIPRPAEGPTANLWYDDDRIGQYLPEDVKPSATSTNPTNAGGVFRCSSDLTDSERSYAMNLWASSNADQFVLNYSPIRQTYGGGPYERREQPLGQFWSSNVSNGSNMILFAESHPKFTTGTGRFSAASVGFVNDPPFFPGDHFGGVEGYDMRAQDFSGGNPGLYPLNQKNSDVAFHRHQRTEQPDGGLSQAVDTFGRANFAFADGHVEILSHKELVDVDTNISTLDAQWSPLDGELTQQRIDEGGGE